MGIIYELKVTNTYGDTLEEKYAYVVEVKGLDKHYIVTLTSIRYGYGEGQDSISGIIEDKLTAMKMCDDYCGVKLHF